MCFHLSSNSAEVAYTVQTTIGNASLGRTIGADKIVASGSGRARADNAAATATDNWEVAIATLLSWKTELCGDGSHSESSSCVSDPPRNAVHPSLGIRIFKIKSQALWNNLEAPSP